jgi:hypothetical protein
VSQGSENILIYPITTDSENGRRLAAFSFMAIEITETWNAILDRVHAKPLRRGRGPCPFCESRTGFSVHNEKGFHCFACGIHGDKVSFIQQFHKCDFKDALRFFGLEPGRPPVPDPAEVRRRKIRANLQRWARTAARELRDQHYIRCVTEQAAVDLLRMDSEDEQAWDALAWALTGIDAIAYRLDQLEGPIEVQVECYKRRKAA